MPVTPDVSSAHAFSTAVRRATSREEPEAIRQLRKLRGVLYGRGWASGDIAYLEAEGATHDEASWAARVEPMLRFVDRQFNAKPRDGNRQQRDPFPVEVRPPMPKGQGTY